MSYHHHSKRLGQADWFFGIKKPPEKYKCAEGLIQKETKTGIRCLPPPPPPPPPAPATSEAFLAPEAAFLAPEAFPVAAPVFIDEEDGLFDFIKRNKLIFAGGGFFLFTALVIFLRRR